MSDEVASVLHPLAAVEGEWPAAAQADSFSRRRAGEPMSQGPLVWSPMAPWAVDPLMQRTALSALDDACLLGGVQRLPALFLFSAETEDSLVWIAAHGGWEADWWSIDRPIVSCCDVARWSIGVHVDVALDEVADLVHCEVFRLARFLVEV